mgnify:CR=1 FL=1
MTGKPEASTSTIGDARRLQIVQAAREICLEKGFSKITISDIAERVGMTRSLFYHYFQDNRPPGRVERASRGRQHLEGA